MPDRIDYEALAATLDGFLREQLFLNYKGELMRCAIAVRALGRERDAAEREATASDLLSDQYARELSAALRRAEEAERALFDLMSVIRFSDGQAHLYSWHDWQDWRERHPEMVLRAKEAQ